MIAFNPLGYASRPVTLGGRQFPGPVTLTAWRLRATYGDNYPRPVQLKNKYDPTSLCHLNANIKPTAPA